jgi:F-type H+-transporting ATPase subunit epsilon
VPEAITLRVITPEAIVVDTTAADVRFPALDGLMGILPRHAPMVAALDAGALTWTEGGQRREMFVAGGFAEVRAGTVRVVTEASEPASEIDAERAEKAAERARERLHSRKAADQEVFDGARAEASLRRAMMRLSVVHKRR